MRRAGEKDDGWSKPACARDSGLGSREISCPVGRCRTEGPPSRAGRPCLEMTTLRVALSPCIPGQNPHRTEHILVVMFTSILPVSIPRQGKSDFLSETHFIQFCTYGDIGPGPTHHSKYHSVENKASYVHSKKKKKKERVGQVEDNRGRTGASGVSKWVLETGK